MSKNTRLAPKNFSNFSVNGRGCHIFYTYMHSSVVCQPPKWQRVIESHIHRQCHLSRRSPFGRGSQAMQFITVFTHCSLHKEPIHPAFNITASKAEAALKHFSKLPPPTRGHMDTTAPPTQGHMDTTAPPTQGHMDTTAPPTQGHMDTTAPPTQGHMDTTAPPTQGHMDTTAPPTQGHMDTTAGSE